MTTLKQAAQEIAERWYCARENRTELADTITTNPTLLAMVQRIAELEKDEARLDWCDRNPLPDFSQVGNDSGWNMRIAIDKAMDVK